MVTNTCERVRIEVPDQYWASRNDIFYCNKAPRARLSPIFYARKTPVHRSGTVCCPNPPCVAFSPSQIKAHLSAVARRLTPRARSPVVDKMSRTVFAAGMFGHNLFGLASKAAVFAHCPDPVAGLRDCSF